MHIQGRPEDPKYALIQPDWQEFCVPSLFRKKRNLRPNSLKISRTYFCTLVVGSSPLCPTTHPRWQTCPVVECPKPGVLPGFWQKAALQRRLNQPILAELALSSPEALFDVPIFRCECWFSEKRIQAGKPRRRRWWSHSKGIIPMRLRH
jgi:hypothetical protein